jgi:hypothetical protein
MYPEMASGYIRGTFARGLFQPTPRSASFPGEGAGRNAAHPSPGPYPTRLAISCASFRAPAGPGGVIGTSPPNLVRPKHSNNVPGRDPGSPEPARAPMRTASGSACQVPPRRLCSRCRWVVPACRTTPGGLDAFVATSVATNRKCRVKPIHGGLGLGRWPGAPQRQRWTG